MTDGVSGVVPVDKPEGPTAHDVVAQARKVLGIRRIGHTGTLDPFASGLMLLCVGPATRIAEYLTGLPKSYEAAALLGVSTDTLDRDGSVVASSGAWRSLSPGAVEAAAAAMVGTQLQVPPQYSAKKVGGVAMHRRARGGETVTLHPVEVTVHALEILDVLLPEVTFRVTCSSGTYVRALARDLGETLEVGAHLTRLRRTQVGGFGVDDAIAVEELGEPDRVEAAWITPLEALAHLPRVDVDEAGGRALGFGQTVEVAASDQPGPVAVARESRLVAIGEVRDGRLRPRKVLQ